MNEPTGAFAPNRDDVAAKVIDGELILIRLSDGTYYSMDGVGTCVWELLEAGAALDPVVDRVADWYATAPERVRGDVARLVRQLLDEGLLVPAADPTAPQAPTPPAEPRTYEPPELHIYRDMGNLLALDPPTPGIDELQPDDAKRD